ncbi:MAG: 3-deoxy-D-manno-octulosonic acid transferase [Chthoniobacterales bacterium]
MRLIYNLLYPVWLLLFLPGYLAKMFRRGNYRHKFGQRFAIYDRATREQLAARNRTWIHAVSVGEVSIALKLAAKIKELDGGFACVLSTTTTTGFALASKQAPGWMEVIYNPLDFWPVKLRAFHVIRPQRIVLVEAEVWPNLVAIARKRRVATALVNARLSPRSERRFRRFRAVVAPTFRCLDLVCVQEAADVDRWAALGVPRECIHHVGSIKFDPEPTAIATTAASERMQQLGIGADQPVLFGGSTHAGEEEVLATVFQQLRREFPLLTLVVAPRHVERTPEIHTRLEELGLDVALRTESRTQDRPPDCILLDTTGELQRWYAVATVVFVGKSLSARGGQNPVEAIVAGKPVMFGPHMENFASLAAALIEGGGAIAISDGPSLGRETARLLRDAAAAARLVENARAVIERHAGATTRTAELLLSLRPSRH